MSLRHAIGCVLLLSCTALHAGSIVVARKAALATASPVATQVGLTVLRSGGNAIDATVAVAFALAVVHPQAGNLGGGGHLLYYDAATGGIWALDFAAVAPMAVKRAELESHPERVQSGPFSAGVPGTVAGLGAMHERFGKRPWKTLLAPAARLAREGFRADGRLVADLEVAATEKTMSDFASSAAVFYPGGKAPAAGTILIQRDLASTIDRLAQAGAKDFYTGGLARRIADGTLAAGGMIGHRDLREYRVRWRAPIQLKFRGLDIYTVPPPSGASLVIGGALNILGGFDLAKSGAQTASTIHLLAEAQRRAFIDRMRYLADPAGVRIAYRDLLSSERATAWRDTIDRKRVTPTSTLTEPGGLKTEGEHTTHFTIVDERGNIAAITTSLGDDFGSGFVVPGTGVLLNKALAEFAYGDRPNIDGLVQSRTNAIEPMRRSTSSMSPTFVFSEGKPHLAIGSRGGAAIPTTLVQLILQVAVFGKSLQDAVAAPRFHHQGSPDEIVYERDLTPSALVDELTALGHAVKAREAIGDVHAVQMEKERIVAVSDPRHGGAAGGY